MIKLYNGDCLDVLTTIKDQPTMVFADLPYGTTHNKWDSIIDLNLLWSRLLHIGTKTTKYIFTANGGFQYILYNSNPDMFKYDMVWDKVIPSGMTYARYQPMRQHEMILVFYDERGIYNPQMILRDKPIKSGGQKNLNTDSTTLDKYKVEGFKREYTHKCPTTIIPFMKVRRNAIHTTQKPVELLEWLIKTYTNEHNLVLDPTMGSGTTGIACLNTNRRFIGIEKDTKIFNAAVERIQQWQKTP